MKNQSSSYTATRDFYIALGRYPEYSVFPFKNGDLIVVEDDGYNLHKIIHGEIKIPFSPALLGRKEYVNGYPNPRGFECAYVTDATLVLQKIFPSQQNLATSRFRVLSMHKQNLVIVVPDADNASDTTIVLALAEAA